MVRAIVFVISLTIISGCGEREREVERTYTESVTAASFNQAGAPTVEFSVPDMMCPEGCGAKTKEILAGQPGAKDVRIDFDAKTAIVAVEEGAFDAEQAVAALVDHGFDHSTLKEATPPLARPQRGGEGLAVEPQAADSPVAQ